MTGRDVVGVDPGAETGAVVWLAPDGRAVRHWWAWERQGGAHDRCSYRLRDAVEAEMPGFAFPELLDHIALHLREMGAAPARLVVEGLFIPARLTREGKTSPGNVGALFLSAGAALQAFGFLSYAREPHRPTAAVWRSRQLGRGAGRLNAEAAEALAVERAEVAFAWPGSLRWLTAAERGAVAEAAWMARDGLTEPHAKSALFLERTP